MYITKKVKAGRDNMQELLVNTDNDNKKILLVENGKLIEKYE